jgi:lysophospholipase L1-like esterase
MTVEPEVPQEYLLQFQHPEKLLAQFPGMNDSIAARLFELTEEEYAAWHRTFEERVRAAVDGMMDEPGFPRAVGNLPFRKGDCIVGFGDSITDYSESWFEMLRCAIHTLVPERGLQCVNLAVSGDTTMHLICRFLEVVAAEPDWILCMAGTNDCRTHGRNPTNVLVTAEETERNLEMLATFARTQTDASLVWLTPTPVDEGDIARDPFLHGQNQLGWHNEDLAVVAELMRIRPEPVVDLQEVMGNPPAGEMLLDDGLHPAEPGHKAILHALLQQLPPQC